jgi:uncharacterized membrane protein
VAGGAPTWLNQIVVSIPPVVFYALGAMLIVFGALRAYMFGWKARRVRALADDLDADQARAEERRAKDQRRHLMMGVIWVLMGIVLIASTLNAAQRLVQ